MTYSFSQAPNLGASPYGNLFSYGRSPVGYMNSPMPQISTGMTGVNVGPVNPLSSFGSGYGATPNQPMSWFDKLIGTKDQPGMAGPLLGLGQTLGSFYFGSQQLKAAERAQRFAEDSFNMNYDAQRNLTNEQLESRGRRRNLERPDIFEDPYSLMSRYGIKERGAM